MHIKPVSHRWRVSPARAIGIQRRLAGTVRHEPICPSVRLVAGVDMALSPDDRRCVAGVVLWDMKEARVVEEHIAVRALVFPYVPGLLSFREAPAVLAALRKLKEEPDVVVCDGHGIAHPRQFGIASHVGVILGRPTLGCAKSRLVGEHKAPGYKRGARTALTHRRERIGTVLRTRDGVKPVFISIGNLVDLPSAESLALRCGDGFRIPAPTRLADRLVSRARKTLE
jgi:deoxyribonuclease V